MRGQKVISREDVAHALLARNDVVELLRLRVATKVEREADAPVRGEIAGAIEVLVLIGAPAVDEEHSGDEGAGREQGAEDMLVFFDPDVDRFIARWHEVRSSCIW